MKRFVVLTLGLTVAGASAVAQDSQTADTSSGAKNLMRELWLVDDARPIPTGQVDLRLTVNWSTASAPANLGDSNDDFTITPSLTWGACENVEAFAALPVSVADGGNRPGLDDGNVDADFGFNWRFCEPEGHMPAAALRVTVRIPTGDGSNGIDGEARLILTNEYDSDLRSHINVFAETINGDSDEDLREFQYGLVIGMDGPLCADGAVRWVADYMNRSGFHNGTSNINILELGWEWDMNDSQKLGMSFQIGLDHTGDTPNFGAGIAYSHSLTY